MSIFGGAAVAVMFPQLILYGGIMMLSGAVGATYYFSTWSKFDRLWESLNMEALSLLLRLKFL
jgi:hypothetical protein